MRAVRNVGAAVALVACLLGCAGGPACLVADPVCIALRYEWHGDIEETGFREPSGIVFDPVRGTLFLVGDEGDIAEMTTDGRILRRKLLIEGLDLEGLTRVPETGLLYAALEGDELILEIDPNNFGLLREFTVPRHAGQFELFRRGGHGLEGICFVPDAEHPEGGTFFVVNQSFELDPAGEKSVIVELELPLRSGRRGGAARILGWFAPGVIDLSGIHYLPDSGHLLVIGDAQNVLIKMATDGTMLRSWALTGESQEGVTFDAEGFMYIAQDGGGVIKIKPDWSEPAP